MADTTDTQQHAAATPKRAPAVGHLVPWTILLATVIVLLILTWITYAATFVDFGGSINLWIAMIIATIKGSLVCLYFMHLRYDRAFNWIAFVTSLAFVTLFIGLTLTDTSRYQKELVPPNSAEFAPGRELAGMDTTGTAESGEPTEETTGG